EITVRLPEGPGFDRDRLRRRLPAGVTLGQQFARMDRRALGEEWEATLRALLETLAPERG
ncbi:MAG TPA: hypothetical protein VGE07_30215, partial [Herpetosiphonaceae bacterium]